MARVNFFIITDALKLEIVYKKAFFTERKLSATSLDVILFDSDDDIFSLMLNPFGNLCINTESIALRSTRYGYNTCSGAACHCIAAFISEVR